jgi:hypothetical protein
VARVEVGDQDVTLHLSTFDDVLSLHGSFRIPYKHIAAASAAPVPQQWYRGVRIGANIPGVMVAGTFFTGDGAIFYDFHNGERCLTLELRHERYRRVVVEVDREQDHAALAAAIQAHLS